MAPLTDISDRLTPSLPQEITFGASPIAPGTKITTLFGHMLSSPGTGSPYQVYKVVNVGDPVAAKAEVDALAGVDSQISKMTYAFVNANAAKSASGNFPDFRVVLIPANRSDFGPNNEATEAVKHLRSDMFVSCYPASDSANEAKLLSLVQLVNGIDRNLQGQFGSFMTLGSLDALATAVAYNFNSRDVIVAYLQDTNTGLVNVTATTANASKVLTAVSGVVFSPTGDTLNGSATISNVSSTAGILPGASISGTGIPSGAIVEQVLANSLVISEQATSTNAADALTIQNQPGTAGIYPGAQLSGTGIAAGSVVVSVTNNTITMSLAATASGTLVAVAAQNVVSQAAEIVASAHAGAMMASAFPYNPLQNVTIGGLVPPHKPSDLIQVDPNGSSEAALVAGLSPLFVQPGGTVAFIRTRTTRVLKDDAVTPETAYIDWQDLVTLNDFKEDSFLIESNPPFNNNPGGTKASIDTANKLKDRILNLAFQYETEGAFQAVKSLAPFFQVAPSSTSRGRFDYRIPINVLPGLYVIAGNIQAVTTFDFTL